MKAGEIVFDKLVFLKNLTVPDYVSDRQGNLVPNSKLLVVGEGTRIVRIPDESGKVVVQSTWFERRQIFGFGLETELVLRELPIGR